MKTKKEFEFDPASGVSNCFITRGDKVYFGSAICHDDDRDMISEITGTEIAQTRANIDMLKCIRDNEIIPGLKALKHLQSCIQDSKNYNKRSYEARMLRRQVCRYEENLNSINAAIASEKKFLKDYTTAKEKIYTKIRAKRQAGKAD